MDEVNTSTVNDEAKVSTQDDANALQEQVSLEDVLNELKAVKQTNARLLEQSKDAKEKYNGIKQEQESKEKETMLAKNQYKEYAEKVEQERNALEANLKKTKRQIAMSNIENEILKMANDADPEYRKFLVGEIKVDEDALDSGHYDAKDLGMQVDLLRKNYPKFFNTTLPTTNTSKPKFINEPTKRPEEMSNEEYKQYLINKYK